MMASIVLAPLDGGTKEAAMDDEAEKKALSLKEVGEQLLDGIVSAKFDFGRKAPIEYGHDLNAFSQLLSTAEGVGFNPAQQAWLKLLKAHGENDACGIQMALQAIVNAVIDYVEYGDAVLVPEVPTPLAEQVEAADLAMLDECARAEEVAVDAAAAEYAEATAAGKRKAGRPAGKRRKPNTAKLGRSKESKARSCQKGKMQGSKVAPVAANPRGSRMVTQPATYADAAVIPAPKASYYERRIAIKYHYFEMDCPERAEWYGKNGTVAKIMKQLNMPEGSRKCVVAVLHRIQDCFELGIDYDGRINSENMGRPVILPIDSVEANVIADSLEMGLSFKMTQMKVYYYRKAEGLDPISYSAIVGCFNRMAKKVSHADKKGAGTDDIEAVWSIARYRWCKQLLIRLGVIIYDGNDGKYEEGQEANLEGMANPPDYFNKDKLTPIEMTQIGWWDETHTKVRIMNVCAYHVIK